MSEAQADPSRRVLNRRAALLLGGAGAGLAAAVGLPGGATPAAADPGPAADRLGVVAVEDFRAPGAADDDALAEALRYAAAQTYKPVVVFANRSYDLTRPVRPFSGMHLAASSFGTEFRDSQVITLPAGGLVSYDVRVRSITLENLSCQVRDHLLQPIARNASQGAWRDVRVLGGGYNGGGTLIEGSVLRLNFQPAYVNNGTDSVLRIGGSDSWLFTQGPHYVSGMLPADRPFLDLRSMTQTVVGSAYITSQGGYGIDISGGGTGLRLAGAMVDATHREGPRATQLAGLQISGGTATTIDDLWVFNADVSGASPALVTVTGGTDIVFNQPRFPAANAGTAAADGGVPCIHTTVPITVIAPMATGRPKVITATDPALVTLVGAPGWEVRQA